MLRYDAFGRQFGEGFITGDAITSATVYLPVAAETAFTNTLKRRHAVGGGVRNGDHALPTVFRRCSPTRAGTSATATRC